MKTDPIEQIAALADELRCEVSRQRCRDFYPRVCDIDAESRSGLGPDWRCATCAVFAALRQQREARLQRVLNEMSRLSQPEEGTGRYRDTVECWNALLYFVRAEIGDPLRAEAQPADSPKVDKHKAGLYRKFDVRRTDGSDGPNGKHYQCSYYVLDITHDPFALPALKAYANACRAEYPNLARDLDAIVAGNPLMPYRTHMPPGPRSLRAEAQPEQEKL